MNLTLKLIRKDHTFEFFTFGLMTNGFRLVPSFYRYPMVSIRWLWFTFTASCLNPLHPEGS